MSSSSSNPPWTYDVFINFRGKDTRYNFVSYLHAALSRAGINTFVDNLLRKGKDVGEQLWRAIEGSQISLVVFSGNYAGSRWCLDELVRILACCTAPGQEVIPIFFHIEPSIVGHQIGDFGKALKAKAEKIWPDDVQMREVMLSRWKTALAKAAKISGWPVNETTIGGELLNQIAKDILTKLYKPLPITEFPVGFESSVPKVIKFIENQSSNDVCKVGIWGMGGSGKTTLAKAIYNRIHHTFVTRIFIEKVREVFEKDPEKMTHFQQELSNVLKTKTNEERRSKTMGTTKTDDGFRGERALVILDDVTTFDQLEALSMNRICKRSETVVIVTTRDLHLLKLLKVDHVYTMKEMDKNESLKLFSWHAFGQQSPRKDFSKLSENVAAYCGGLPFALRELGIELSGRDELLWKSLLSRLERNPNAKVQEKLKLCYEDLKENEPKNIFLDICCFFIGKDRTYVTKILNGCGLYADIGIAVLIERSLLKVENNNKLQMHRLLRDMGREIVCQSSTIVLGERSRLWHHNDVQHVLTSNSGTKTVEGLVLRLHRTSRNCFSTESFKDMNNLRLLQLDYVDLTGDYGHLSKQLKWVSWRQFIGELIPDEFYLGNLVVIDLKHSNIKVWKETELLMRLKILNLSHSKYLKSTPNFSNLPNLEKLIMKDCPKLCELHSSIGDLSEILLINLEDCTSLSNLPRKIYQLKSLQTLILSGCSMIDKLEEDIVQMKSLMTLIAKDTIVKEVLYTIVTSKGIGYISSCGYGGFPPNVFLCLTWPWVSPTSNSSPLIYPFWGMSLFVVSLDVKSNNLGLHYLSLLISNLLYLRSVKVQCHSKSHLTQELRFLNDQYGVNFSELETPHVSQIPDLSLGSLLSGTENCHKVICILSTSIPQGLATNLSGCSFLVDNNDASLVAYTCQGPSVLFHVPMVRDCCMKGITLRVVYPRTPENMAIECLASVLIINYTKCTIQIFKLDTTMSFNDEDWQGVVSNLGVGDSVKISVAFGDGLTVKQTIVHLIYGQPITTELARSDMVEDETPTDKNMETSPGVNVQPSPNERMEPTIGEDVQLSPNFPSSLTEEPRLEFFDEHNPPNEGSTISGDPESSMVSRREFDEFRSSIDGKLQLILDFFKQFSPNPAPSPS